METIYLMGILLGLMVILAIWRTIEKYKKRGQKGAVLYLKEFVDSNKNLVYLLFTLYLTVGSLAVFPAIKDYADNLKTTSLAGELLVNKGIPMAWLIFTIFVIFYIMRKSRKPLFKYSDQEKQWQEEDTQNNKVRQWLKGKFPKLFKERGTVNGNQDKKSI